MRIIKGFDSLLFEVKILLDVGWLYVDKEFNLKFKMDILNKDYYFVENCDEFFDMVENDKIRIFLEFLIFCDIIDNRFNYYFNFNRDEFLEVVIYYLEEDDFMD